MKRSLKVLLICLIGLMLADELLAQNPMRRMPGAGNRFGRTTAGEGDTLATRTGLEDSITINFRFLDTTRLMKFDSSVMDFSKKIPLAWDQVHLGNLGTATRNLQFSPLLRSGWDNGTHAFDNYNFTVGETRFYNTTRPYSELGYMLGSQAEQLISMMHTQNLMPNWNMAAEYRLMNSSGFFQNQNINHNNYRISSWYQSKNKRYQNFVIILGNKLQSGENGGILQDSNYLDNVAFDERMNIPTNIGMSATGTRNFFSSNVSTGSKYTNATFLLRQQYDLGQKDSLVTDSLVIPLFYPRLRLEHSIAYKTYKYRFNDENADSLYYANRYGITDTTGRIFVQDHWKELLNDFSIYQFPDAKNPLQYVKAGAAFQQLTGIFDTGALKRNFYNFYVHGEYRNKTRNQKWDIEANGNFYISGLNAGDYDALISLKRFVSRQIGYLQIGFQNVNRTPSFIFDEQSSFYTYDNTTDFNKENTIHLFGSLDQPVRNFRLSGSYFMLNNYTYHRNWHVPAQATALFNVLRVTADKRFAIGKKGFNWKTRVVLQQKAGDAPINLPLILTRNQVGYDGNLGFKNLLISMGLELRYFTPYKANNYSPLNGQFFYQDSITVKMKVPEVTAYIHLRIKSFTAYFRAENLNTFDVSRGGFYNNNILTPGYPYPGMQIRLGIFWGFVN